MEKYITVKANPSQKYYDYMYFISYYGDKIFVIEDRYHRLNFEPHVPKVDYFYFKRLSEDYKDKDPEKAKQYIELEKLFEGSVNYNLERIAESIRGDIGVPIERIIDMEDEDSQFSNWMEAVVEQFKKYYLTDDVTVTMEED